MSKLARGGSALLIVIASVACGFASFYRLWARRLYRQFFVLCGLLSAWIAFLVLGFSFAMSIDDANRRVWFVIPIVIQCPVLMFSGFWLYKHVDEIIDERVSTLSVPPDKRIRALGVGLIAVFLSIWFYGISHSLEQDQGLVALATMCYAAVFGVPYLITGRWIKNLK